MSKVIQGVAEFTLAIKEIVPVLAGLPITETLFSLELADRTGYPLRQPHTLRLHGRLTADPAAERLISVSGGIDVLTLIHERETLLAEAASLRHELDEIKKAWRLDERTPFSEAFVPTVRTPIFPLPPNPTLKEKS